MTAGLGVPSALEPTSVRVREPSVLHQRVDATKRAFNRADALVSITQACLRGDQPNRAPVEMMITIPASNLQAGTADPVDVGCTRDLETHFRNGCTGRSTLRRTFAALLREQLRLSPIPRSTHGAARPSHFALNEEDDERLTEWMSKHLELAVWPMPTDCKNPNGSAYKWKKIETLEALHRMPSDHSAATAVVRCSARMQ